MPPYVKLEIEAPIATITLSRSPVNALDPILIQQFDTALNAIETAQDVSIVVIRSDVKAFCAGADLAVVGGFLQSSDPSADMSQYTSSVQRLFDRIEHFSAVTICDIRGIALGGGLELALTTDFRLASSRAKFGLPEATLGLIPAAGGTQRLTRLAGIEVARRLIFTGQVLTAKEALACGLITDIYPDENHNDGVATFVAELAKQPAEALRAAKRCLAKAFPTPQDGYDSEVREISALVQQKDTQQRLQAFLNPTT